MIGLALAIAVITPVLVLGLLLLLQRVETWALTDPKVLRRTRR